MQNEDIEKEESGKEEAVNMESCEDDDQKEYAKEKIVTKEEDEREDAGQEEEDGQGIQNTQLEEDVSDEIMLLCCQSICYLITKMHIIIMQ